MTNRRFFMCPPTFYDVKYAINDWMDLNIRVNKSLAQEQWEKLYHTYLEMGAEVTKLDAIDGLPDLVFPGDAVFLYQNKVVASNFFHQERCGEVSPRIEYFKDLGFSPVHLPEEIKYEGNADTIRWGNIFLGGYGVRSSKEAYPIISESLDIEIIPIKFNAPSFHLDVAVFPINEDTIAYSPDALEDDSIATLEKMAKNTIKVSLEESLLLSVNCIVMEDTVLMSTKKAPTFSQSLTDLGLNVVPFDMSEFFKSGGGVKCLTLEHYR